MKKILLLFLITSIPFGLAMSISYGDITIGLIAGLSFGAIKTFILGVYNFFSVKSRGGKMNSSVHQDYDVELSLPYHHAFELCKQAVLQTKRAKITYEDSTNGQIHARTGITFQSWGEKIICDIHKLNEQTSSINIQSKPIIPTTLVDYGKGLENIQRISKYIERNK